MKLEKSAARQFLSIVGSAALFLVLGGCTPAVVEDIPTTLPTEYLPTAIYLTLEASGLTHHTPEPTLPPDHTLPPTVTPTFTPTLTPSTWPLTQTAAWFTPTDTSTPTLLPNWPYGRLQILKPGPMSIVTSPLHLVAFLIPGDNGLVQLEIVGEDGRTLVDQLVVFTGNPEARTNYAVDIPFEIPGVAEAGRFKMTTRDQFNRLWAVATVDLVLLSTGEADLTPIGDNIERIVIQEPTPNILIQGGMLYVSGIIHSITTNTLVAELTTSQGKVVGQRIAAVSPVPGENYGTFTVEVPYTVTASTWVRLAVYENGDRIPGIVHLSSLEVLISP